MDPVHNFARGGFSMLQLLRINRLRADGRATLAGIGVCLAMSLAACATQTALPPVPPTPPPVVQSAPPETSAKPAKIVKASYQSSRTAGRPTASGEPYNPNGLTAASRTLPIGSTVEVVNPATGRSVKVLINDRGPFVHGRDLDLSKRAAEKIGITHKGVARVKVVPVGSHPAASSASEAPPSAATPAARD
jgi:peptidoglycan lytic transglycosylase